LFAACHACVTVVALLGSHELSTRLGWVLLQPTRWLLGQLEAAGLTVILERPPGVLIVMVNSLVCAFLALWFCDLGRWIVLGASRRSPPGTHDPAAR
jgi:hypothetical protein